MSAVQFEEEACESLSVATESFDHELDINILSPSMEIPLEGGPTEDHSFFTAMDNSDLHNTDKEKDCFEKMNDGSEMNKLEGLLPRPQQRALQALIQEVLLAGTAYFQKKQNRIQIKSACSFIRQKTPVVELEKQESRLLRSLPLTKTREYPQIQIPPQPTVVYQFHPCQGAVIPQPNFTVVQFHPGERYDRREQWNGSTGMIARSMSGWQTTPPIQRRETSEWTLQWVRKSTTQSIT